MKVENLLKGIFILYNTTILFFNFYFCKKASRTVGFKHRPTGQIWCLPAPFPYFSFHLTCKIPHLHPPGVLRASSHSHCGRFSLLQCSLVWKPLIQSLALCLHQSLSIQLIKKKPGPVLFLVVFLLLYSVKHSKGPKG